MSMSTQMEKEKLWKKVFKRFEQMCDEFKRKHPCSPKNRDVNKNLCLLGCEIFKFKKTGTYQFQQELKLQNISLINNIYNKH